MLEHNVCVLYLSSIRCIAKDMGAFIVSSQSYGTIVSHGLEDKVFFIANPTNNFNNGCCIRTLLAQE